MDALLRLQTTAGLVIMMAMCWGCENQQSHEQLADAAPYDPVLDAGPMPHNSAPAPEPAMAYYDTGAATASASRYEPPPVSYSANSYVVQKGDTLWSIAKRVYNDGRRWRDIQSANPGVQPSRLRVGQQILLP